MATKKIGTGAGLGTMDYTDLNSWDAYMNALGTFAADEIGRVCWASSANEMIFAAQQVLDGSTPGSFSIFLEAGDSAGAQGGSFKDNANKLTNALRYNASNGACIAQTTDDTNNFLNAQDDKIIVRNLQIRSTTTRRLYNSDLAATGRQLNECILFADSTTGGRPVIYARDITVRNCLAYGRWNASGMTAEMWVNFGTSSAMNCTFISLNSQTTNGFNASGTALTITNTVIANFANDLSGAATLSGSNNATDKTAATSALPSTGRQTDLVLATEFLNVSSAATADFRLASGSVKLRNNGTATGAPSSDIVGSTRPQ